MDFYFRKGDERALMGEGAERQVGESAGYWASGWRAEDFSAPVRGQPVLSDPWSVVVVNRPLKSVGSAREDDRRSGDWAWDLPLPSSPAVLTGPAGADAQWAVDAPLPSFTPDAAENPFILAAPATQTERLAAKRARWLVNLLDVPEQWRRQEYLRFFEELFAEYEHHATYDALVDLVLDDEASADELVAACGLRRRFLERPEWWALRLRGGAVVHAAAGEALMGWRRALRFVRCCDGDPADVIAEDWFSDWIDLPPYDPHRTRYVDYLQARLETFAQGIWAPCQPLCRTDRTREWRHRHGLSGGSPFSRTASLAGLKSWKEDKPRC